MTKSPMKSTTNLMFDAFARTVPGVAAAAAAVVAAAVVAAEVALVVCEEVKRMQQWQFEEEEEEVSIVLKVGSKKKMKTPVTTIPMLTLLHPQQMKQLMLIGLGLLGPLVLSCKLLV